ncbi:hypothetical protein [Aurantimonas marina]|uniref:hypothetical protein n=1 Tax=Aurantimonas marina TaxID=2780508 RepID=UPI0019CF614B|nr:hypothetical protein [Aurantimonas marina]
MRRLATTLTLSAWTGFTALTGLRLAQEAGMLDSLAGDGWGGLLALMPIPLEFGLLPHQALAFAAVFAALAIGFGMGIAGLNASSAAAARRAEPVAGAVLVALVALCASAALTGSPLAAVFGEGPGFLVSVAFTFGALLFDHLMEVEEDGADDATFEAILQSIRAAERRALIENQRSSTLEESDDR